MDVTVSAVPETAGRMASLVSNSSGGDSLLSFRSLNSLASFQSAASVVSALSLASFGSILSIASAGSILSIASAGSILSIGSAGSILCIGSAGSILCIGSAGSILKVGQAANPADSSHLATSVRHRTARRGPGQSRPVVPLTLLALASLGIAVRRLRAFR